MAAKTRFINPEPLGKPPSYTHVVEVTGPGRTVYIAGQLGIDRDGKVVSSDFRAAGGAGVREPQGRARRGRRRASSTW